MRETKFRIQHNSNDIIFLAASFEDDEWETLESFLTYVDELNSTSIVKNGAIANIKLEINDNLDLTYQIEKSPTIEISELLHKVRPFILQDEPTYFHKVTNIIKRRIDDAIFRNSIDNLKKLFDGNEMSAVLKIELNNYNLIDQATLKKWLNSYEYHRDKDMRKEIENLNSATPIEFTKTIFFMLIIEKLKAIKSLACVLYPILGIEDKTVLQVN